jgi:hypothetical protein
MCFALTKKHIKFSLGCNGKKGQRVPADQVQQGARQFVPEAGLDECENAKL